MKTYTKRLKSHPGVPMMMVLTPAFVLAGMANQNMGLLDGALVGFISTIPFWLIVLVTARTQPIHSKYLDKEQQ